MIQLLLILTTNAGRLEERKKKQEKNKQTNKQKTEKFVHWTSIVIMENEIRAASKHAPDVQKMAITLSTRAQLFKRWIPLGYPSDKLLPSG